MVRPIIPLTHDLCDVTDGLRAFCPGSQPKFRPVKVPTMRSSIVNELSVKVK